MLLVELRQTRSRVVGEADLDAPVTGGDVVEHENKSRERHRAEHDEHQDQRQDLPARHDGYRS